MGGCMYKIGIIILLLVHLHKECNTDMSGRKKKLSGFNHCMSHRDV